MPAPKKKPRAPKKSRSPSVKHRSGSGSRRKFWSALLLSAGTSFGAASCVLQPQWNVSLPSVAMPAWAAPWTRELVARLGPWLQAQLPGVAATPTRGPPAAGRMAPASTGTTPAARTDAGPNAGTNAAADAHFAGCRDMFPQSRPPAPPSGLAGLRELCFDAFAVLYNPDTKTPVYVVERLSRASLQAAKSIARTDRFYAEARLPASARAQLEDYRGSGYARGHMAPAADMPTDTAMAQSFSLANMVPQDMSHNSGPWNRIEQDTRQYVMRARGDVYVFTGPAYLAARTPRIGDSGVAVPSHLFKLVHDPETGRSWAHWHQNQSGAQAMRPISEEALVQKLGIDFLHSAD